MNVRAKFYVASKTEKSNGMQPGGGWDIAMNPVYADQSPENKEFYKWTPGGQLVLTTVNEAAAKAFEVGKQYYVDFTPAS